MTPLNWSAIVGRVSMHGTPRICVVVLLCPSCELPHHIGVRLVRAGELSYCIPERCACGAGLRTATHHADIRDTSLQLLSAGYGDAA